MATFSPVLPTIFLVAVLSYTRRKRSNTFIYVHEYWICSRALFLTLGEAIWARVKYQTYYVRGSFYVYSNYSWHIKISRKQTHYSSIKTKMRKDNYWKYMIMKMVATSRVIKIGASTQLPLIIRGSINIDKTSKAVLQSSKVGCKQNALY